MSATLQLIISLIMTVIPPAPNGQWEVCGYAPFPRTVMASTVVGVFPTIITLEVADPSCPGVNDGWIEVKNAILDSDGGQFSYDVFASSGLGYPIVNNAFVGLGAGTYRIVFQFPGNVFRSFDVTLKGPITPELYVRSIGHETCPGEADGFVILSYRPKNVNAYANVYWEDLDDYTLQRTGLASGTYPFTYYVDDYYADCCQDGQIVIGSQQCAETVIQWSFLDGIPPGGFTTPPGVLAEVDGLAQYTGNGTVTIPLDQVLQAVVLVKLFFSGLGSIRAFDTNFQTIASQTLNGVGYFQFVFNTTATHFYIEITGEGGAGLRDFCVLNMEQEPEPIEYQLTSPADGAGSSRAAPQEVCLGDTTYAFTGFSVQGGLTPYVYAWDTDNDGAFEDGDSINVPLVFDETGTHTVRLAVSDFAAQSDTLEFEYQVLPTDSVRFDVAGLGISNATFKVLTVCSDQPAFTIDVVAGNGNLSSSSPGLTGNVFDPATAGPGQHYVAVEGDACAPGAGLFIAVLDDPDAGFDPLPELYTCDEPVILSSLFSGDTTGLWVVDNAYPVLNDTLDPAGLTPGAHTLSYMIGEGLCRDSTGQEITIIPAPFVELGMFVGTLLSTDEPYDLNALLSASTPGGVWSGGDYISGNMFDPSGLTTGTYPAIYTIGQGSCVRTDTTFIEVEEVTAVRDLDLHKYFDVFPNPAHDDLRICLSDESAEVRIELYDFSGRQLSLTWSTASVCRTADISDLNSGVYLARLIDLTSAMVYTGKVIVK